MKLSKIKKLEEKIGRNNLNMNQVNTYLIFRKILR